jgi:FkbM family methyltransferase
MIASPIAELDALLAESVAAAMERERTEFERIAGPHASSIVLFGARKMGRKLLAGLRRAHIEPCAFCDNNADLWGSEIEGVPVLSPRDAAAQFGQSAVFVIAIWGRGSTDTMRDRIQRLRELGCARVTSFGALFWKFPEYFLPRIPALDLPHKLLEQSDAVRHAYGMLADDRSRREFVAQVRWRLTLDFDALPDPVAEPIYFPRDVVELRRDEVYVDCGAYDGDTILQFLRLCDREFRSVVAFEPDPISRNLLEVCIAGLPEAVRRRIRIDPAATGEESGTVPFSATGELGSAAGGGDLEVDVVALDQTLVHDRPTYIKMDIEGAEPGALLGARAILARSAPVIAACAYHQQDHLWQLPNLISELNPEYRIYLRPHIQAVEDLVCYAVPPQRSRS